MTHKEQAIRALAMEEAAQYLNRVFDQPTMANELRALAPLPPGLVAVPWELLKILLIDLRRVDEVMKLGSSAGTNTHFRVQGAVAALDSVLKP